MRKFIGEQEASDPKIDQLEPAFPGVYPREGWSIAEQGDPKARLRCD